MGPAARNISETLLRQTQQLCNPFQKLRTPQGPISRSKRLMMYRATSSRYKYGLRDLHCCKRIGRCLGYMVDTTEENLLVCLAILFAFVLKRTRRDYSLGSRSISQMILGLCLFFGQILFCCIIQNRTDAHFLYHVMFSHKLTTSIHCLPRFCTVGATDSKSVPP